MISYTSDHPRAAPPIIMMMMEDEVGHCVVTAAVESDDVGFADVLLSLSVDAPDGVSAVISGSSVDVTVKFAKSPFEYTVTSIDDHDVSHVADDFADVPCVHRTFAYDRIGRDVLDLPLTVIAVMSTLNGIQQVVNALIIKVLPNYSIGQIALLEQLSCQDQ